MYADISAEFSEYLDRYVEQYNWNWGVIRRLINARFGTAYTAVQLKQIYRKRSCSAK